MTIHEKYAEICGKLGFDPRHKEDEPKDPDLIDDKPDPQYDVLSAKEIGFIADYMYQMRTGIKVLKEAY